MLKRFIYIAILALVSCSGSNEEHRTLSVSIEPQRKLLEELAGDDFEVVTVMANGANPETYDPSVSQRMAVNNSAVYFITGYLPFEQAIAAGVDNTKITNTSYGIDRLMGTHSHGSDHAEEIDPHVWTSVRNAKIMASNMTDELVKLNPSKEDKYRKRYEKMCQRLDSLDQANATKLQQAGAHAFVVWHPSLSYYARDYGLHQIAVGQESKEQSVSNLRDIINEARQDSAKVFFFQREYDSRQAESLNKEIGTRLITINPLAYEWEEEIINITDELSK